MVNRGYNSALHSPADACLASALELSGSLRAAAAAKPSLAATRATVGVANAAVPGAGQHGPRNPNRSASNSLIIICVTIGYITINNDGLKLLFIIIRHLLKHCILKMMETTNSNPELQRPPRHMFSLHPVFEVLVLRLAVQHSAPFNTIV